ncbi:MAG: 4Fe-4S binding protein [Methylococcales bacterium]|jgi:ferredoxin-type protein NapG|nr:4Fe-4S binding protein [Methylococcales bacterium]MBT7410637.1 4Fe-4S binding protein [Methylococcales bacterium]
MDRRAFFKRSVKTATETTIKHVDESVNNRARRWIRPPYAISELQFLMSCTRCTDCADACPQKIIFPLSAKLGAQVVNTPAMDLLNKGCHLCDDWPCVNACEANALELPGLDEDEPNNDSIKWPKLAIAKINQQECLPFSGPECGACIASCKIPNALLLKDNKPVIDPELCVGCGLCREFCITEPRAIEISTISA